MGLIGNFFSRLAATGGPQAQAATAPATAGVAFTIARLLGSSSTLSLLSGTNANLTLSGNQIGATAAIAPGASQTAIVREVSGQLAVEYPVVLSGAAGTLTLTLTGPLTYSTTAAAGTLVANIGNVPAGITPTLTPNDGRLVIAGSAGAWTVVTGLSASTAGTITLAVAATGATGASAGVTVVAGALPMAPGYLTYTTNLLAFHGAQRVLPAYTGPLFRAYRASDGAMRDVALVGDFFDVAALRTWNGGPIVPIITEYDQTGNGWHKVEPTLANMPVMDLDQVGPNGFPVILYDGYGKSTNAFLQTVLKKMSIAGLSLDLTANSIFMTVQPKVGLDTMALVQGVDSAGTVGIEEFFSGGTLNLRSAGATSSGTNGPMRSSIDTVGFTSSATVQTLYSKGAVRTQGAARTSTVIPKVVFGTSATGGTGYNAIYKSFGSAIYSAALDSTTAGPAVVAQMNTAFGKPTAYDYTILGFGDSILVGSGTAYLKNIFNQLSLTKRVELFNLAIHGTTMQLQYGQRTHAATVYATLGGKPMVVFLQAGTNDIFAGGSAGATVYNSYDAPFISYLHGLGANVFVVLCTVLPCTNGPGWTSAKETERLNLNALRVANTGGATGASGVADLVLDLTQNPVMGPTTAPADTTIYGDMLHPTTLGDTWLAGPSGTYINQYTYQAALQTAVRTLTGNTSYVP